MKGANEGKARLLSTNDSRSLDSEPNEDKILTCCALRFDGYACFHETGLSFPEATARIVDANLWSELRDERLAVFFALQRFLFKWGGESLPKNGNCWRVFRALFLDLHHAEIPERFKSPEHADAWNRIDRDRAVTLVRLIHETTFYDDTVPPAPSDLTVRHPNLPKRQRR